MGQAHEGRVVAPTMSVRAGEGEFSSPEARKTAAKRKNSRYDPSRPHATPGRGEGLESTICRRKADNGQSSEEGSGQGEGGKEAGR